MARLRLVSSVLPAREPADCHKAQALAHALFPVEPEFGGETAFTDSEWAHPEMAPPQETLSDCAKGHVAYKPKRGDALLFYDLQVGSAGGERREADRGKGGPAGGVWVGCVCGQ